ncbi:MAG TPA: cytidine deaminase [Blastocatellia bacterium]|nr:cytidine deaminase [Blastocatellia bacterium]
MNLRSDQELVELARQAREQAYAPYSRFKVGAALESQDGRIFTGCNVENSSYPLSICAERVALGKAVSEGVRRFSRLAVIADTHAPIPPCGACRQVIMELCGEDVLVLMADLKGHLEARTIGYLLPAPFDQSFL